MNPARAKTDPCPRDISSSSVGVTHGPALQMARLTFLRFSQKRHFRLRGMGDVYKQNTFTKSTKQDYENETCHTRIKRAGRVGQPQHRRPAEVFGLERAGKSWSSIQYRLQRSAPGSLQGWPEPLFHFKPARWLWG